MSQRTHHCPPPHQRPYVLLETTDPSKTLGDGHARRYRDVVQASNAFAKSQAPFKTVVFDNGHEARELDEREETMFVEVCRLHGLDVENA